MSCPICRGAGTIDVNETSEVEGMFRDPDDKYAMPRYRRVTYDCPRCKPQVPRDKVRVIAASRVISDFHYDQATDQAGIKDALLRDAVKAVVYKLVEDRVIRVEETREDDRHGGQLVKFTAVLAVVDENEARTIEEHRRENQELVAQVALNQVASEVSIWGRDVGCTHLEKSHIYRLLDSAARGLHEIKLHGEKVPE